ncbi:MAG: hypothetical protein N2D54_09350 [Chloroflexota bacterium]
MTNTGFTPQKIRALYDQFNTPITEIDCGEKCAPHNPSGKPFCCDSCHAVPTAYQEEWDYLKPNTNLWHTWQAEHCEDTPEEAAEAVAGLQEETPDTMILIECLGPQECQRDFRALTCRQFPFFPYVDSKGQFIGLSYYWEYEVDCWVISNLHKVTDKYRKEFIAAFEEIFDNMPEELDTYQYHSNYMRGVYNKKQRAIPLLHRNGQNYKITTTNEKMRRIPVEKFPKYGPYKLTALMPFPDEIE